MPALGPRPRDLHAPSEAEIRKRIQRQALAILAAFAAASLALFEILPDDLVQNFAALLGIGLLVVLVIVFSTLLVAGARREAALEGTLSLFIESLPVGVMFTDAAGKVTYANPSVTALLTGDPAADIRGRSGIDIVVPEERARVAAEIARRKTGAASTYEVHAQRATGEIVTAVITASPFQREGAFDGSMAVVVDVSEVVEARARAARYRDLASFALDVVTHDLSNRMQGVVAQASLAGMLVGKDDAKARKALASVQAAADQAGRLIKEVKQIAAAEREQWPKRRMPARELLDRAMAMADLPAEAGLAVGLTPEAQACVIEASDLGALGLAKMLEAAAEGSQGGGVTLEAKAQDGEVLLRVKGYRKVVSDADLAQLFAPPTQIGSAAIAWRSGVKFALAGAIWQAKGWQARAVREGDEVAFEVTAPRSPEPAGGG